MPDRAALSCSAVTVTVSAAVELLDCAKVGAMVDKIAAPAAVARRNERCMALSLASPARQFAKAIAARRRDFQMQDAPWHCCQFDAYAILWKSDVRRAATAPTMRNRIEARQGEGD